MKPRMSQTINIPTTKVNKIPPKSSSLICVNDVRTTRRDRRLKEIVDLRWSVVPSSQRPPRINFLNKFIVLKTHVQENVSRTVFVAWSLKKWEWWSCGK